MSPRPTGSLRRWALSHRDHRKPECDELARRELTAAFVGVDQEGAFDPVGDATPAAVGLRHGELEAEAEAGPLAEFGIDPDLAVHELDQALRDGEPESRPVEAAVHFVFDLIELPEDVAAHLGRDADARILDRNGDVPVTGAARAAHDADGDRSRLRELHRVAEEVREHLPDAAGIAHEVGRHEEGRSRARARDPFPAQKG